jgi:hypothetical protein
MVNFLLELSAVQLMDKSVKWGDASLDAVNSNLKTIQKELESGYILWRNKNWNENLWRLNVG